MVSPSRNASGTGAGHLEPLQRGHVVQRDAVAGRQRLGAGDRRPVARRPVVARRDPVRVAVEQSGVGLEPVRPLPAAPLEEARRRVPAGGRGTGWSAAGAATPSAGAGGGCRRPRRSSGSPALAHVGGRELVRLEAVDVALVDVESTGRRRRATRRVAFATPGGMGDPHGLGQPEAAHVARFAHQRHAVGREREDAVDALLAGRAAQRGDARSWAQPHDWAKSSSVNSSTDGITGASAGARSVAGSIGIGRWPYAPMPRRSTCSR